MKNYPFSFEFKELLAKSLNFLGVHKIYIYFNNMYLRK